MVVEIIHIEIYKKIHVIVLILKSLGDHIIVKFSRQRLIYTNILQLQ
jgi:hypothetical protein